jgi:DNA uptake protein ComE-like DNA-binding protein
MEVRLRVPSSFDYWMRQLGIGQSGVIATVVAVLGLASAAMWFYRDARSVAEDFASAKGSRCVNVNTADVAMLSTLPGVGDTLAHRIIAGRPYKTVDDLQRVSGIGPRSLDGFRPFVIVEGESRKRKEGESC